MIEFPNIYCPWCHKCCLPDIDGSEVLEMDDWSKEFDCEHCGERFTVRADVSIDFITEKIQTHEPGDKVYIDNDLANTGCIVQKVENNYIVFVDQYRANRTMPPDRLKKAEGVWVHPDQLAIPLDCSGAKIDKI